MVCSQLGNLGNYRVFWLYGLKLTFILLILYKSDFVLSGGSGYLCDDERLYRSSSQASPRSPMPAMGAVPLPSLPWSELLKALIARGSARRTRGSHCHTGNSLINCVTER